MLGDSMVPTLPARRHYGTVLRKWESGPFSLFEIRYSAGVRHAVHANEEALLAFIEKGTYTKRVARKELICATDSVVFVPANHPQADVFGPLETTCVVVDFAPSFLNHANELGAFIDDEMILSGVQFASLGAHLSRELKDADSASGLSFESLVLGIFAGASRARLASHHPRIPPWLTRAKELLHERLSESFTIESIANEVGAHPVHLSHEFRRFLKVTPGKYLRHIRVEFAAKQLVRTVLPLSEIALISGFGDQAHFSRTFRRITGLSPGEFRRLRGNSL